MNSFFQKNRAASLSLAIIACAAAFIASRAWGAGADYPNGMVVDNIGWPGGMKQLVNTTNRVGGLRLNGGDMFFFAGTASNFNAFLDDYSKIQGLKNHRLILHEGRGAAHDLGGGNPRPCDWKVDGGLRPWADFEDGTKFAATDTNYVLEVHFWTGGRIATNEIVIPKNVEVVNEPARQANGGFRPKAGMVPDAETAIKIAVAVWEPIYGQDHVAAEKPYHAVLTDDVWVVDGSLPENMAGGTAHAEIAKEDGRILKVIHGQ